MCLCVCLHSRTTLLDTSRLQTYHSPSFRLPQFKPRHWSRMTWCCSEGQAGRLQLLVPRRLADGDGYIGYTAWWIPAFLLAEVCGNIETNAQVKAGDVRHGLDGLTLGWANWPTWCLSELRNMNKAFTFWISHAVCVWRGARLRIEQNGVVIPIYRSHCKAKQQTLPQTTIFLSPYCEWFSRTFILLKFHPICGRPPKPSPKWHIFNLKYQLF